MQITSAYRLKTKPMPLRNSKNIKIKAIKAKNGKEGEYWYGILHKYLDTKCRSIEDVKFSYDIFPLENTGYFPITLPIIESTIVEVTVEPRVNHVGNVMLYCIEDKCFILRGKASEIFTLKESE